MNEQKTLNVANATVTLNTTQTPSEKLIQAGNREVAVTDTLGRVIVLKKPDPLSNLDFAKAAGSDRLNVLYLSEVAHLKYVASIDGAPVPTPSSEAELRALYVRLGDEGNAAALEGVVEIVKPAQPGQDDLKNS
ncbi:hypothetical protein [Serratia marcescens]|uniref:hypothetical protein n=1 Tax=Serratia marcescens TaxID=615 RepID=UPI001249C207|nr:hypothetical protein [Serratia marcescens]KAB1578762.1 hypothetical protein F7687_22800 [Serratia marcescens]